MVFTIWVSREEGIQYTVIAEVEGGGGKDHVLPGCDTAIWHSGNDVLDEPAASIIRAETDKQLPILFTSVITD